MSEYIDTLALDGEEKAHSLHAQMSSVSQSDPSMSDTSQADDIPQEVASSQATTIYLKGARLHMITAAFEALFFTSLKEQAKSADRSHNLSISLYHQSRNPDRHNLSGFDYR
ncbi:uncharacterized protein EAE97_011307 [Botrytis byssoidea]|uniref:Uncharacterized protein n=1 Tax=Botrytis byssoidea TaxID=139641 RepID=A0A9P5LRC1_9HELO|nr:uncharacterized protein EAE97_011307 [Botrytis byssoidea]KAF7921518.1 hypothetical protein EAE97_011307 [Botrytis byssoidea]